MDKTKKYWLEKLFYIGWSYIIIMFFLEGELSTNAHLLPLSLLLFMLQNYLINETN